MNTKPKWEWTEEDWERSPIDSMGQKQFWAKTRAEIEQEGKDAVRGLRGERASVNKLKGSKHYANWRLKSDSRELTRAIEHKQQYYQGLLSVHKEKVVEALAAGKPVPTEVLRDYPDLAKEHGLGSLKVSHNPEPSDTARRASKHRVNRRLPTISEVARSR